MDETGFTAAKHLQFTTDAKALHQADFIIVAVPTPIDAVNQPDLRPLIGASRTVGANMKKGATVIFESTVFPGATEDVCVPILEEMSGLKWRQDFQDLGALIIVVPHRQYTELSGQEFVDTLKPVDALLM